MKLHTTLISGGLVTAVMADQTPATRLRRLKADSKASKRSSSKAAKSSYSYSSSMSYGPPTPPSPVPPTPLPTPPPTPVPTAPPTGCCMDDDSAVIRQAILNTVYPDGDASIFENSPQKEAIEWLVKDACECGLFCFSSASLPRVVQRYILAVLYYSTQGDSWKACSAPVGLVPPAFVEECQVQSNYGSNIQVLPDDDPDDENETTVSVGYEWLTCSAECGIQVQNEDPIQIGWAGTRCNRRNELIAIDIENNGLAGELADELRMASKLTALALEQNNIGGNIPASYSELTKMVVLDLDFNSLSGPLFDVSGMTELQQLDLNSNSLEGSITGLGWENTGLKFLDLSLNAFTGPIAQEIGDIASLEKVQVQCNQFANEQLNWNICPEDDFQADDYICDSANCDCTESYTPAECAASTSRGG